MWTATDLRELPKPELYQEVYGQLKALLEGESDAIANMATCAALLFNTLPQVNWVGFYLLKNGELVVGPFQGKPACLRIQMGRGVCGAAAERRAVVRVPNVEEFPGHIACDSASRSEIVLPLISRGEVLGVLDIDSPIIDRFDEKDEAGLILIAGEMTRKLS